LRGTPDEQVVLEVSPSRISEQAYLDPRVFSPSILVVENLQRGVAMARHFEAGRQHELADLKTAGSRIEAIPQRREES